MKVKNYIADAQNGTNIIIVESVFFPKGDTFAEVFVGTVGKIGKCDYLERDVDYFRLIDNILELNISRID